MTRACLLFLLLSLLAACKGEGLGRPVVDRTRTGTSSHSCETRPLSCEDAIGAPRALDVGVRDPMELPACVLGGRLSGSRITGTLHSCRLTLDASMSDEFEIVDATLESLLIQLDGRVRLRIVESRMYQVTIEGGAAAEPERPPLVQVSHSDLSWTQINADLLELLSSRLVTVGIDVGQLSAVDINTKESLLLARDATISAGNLNTTQVGGGDTLLVAGTKTINCRFAAGDGLTRIYDSELTNAIVDGQIVSDLGTFADCRFGVEAPTQLHGWFTSINNSILCERLDQLRYSGGDITCTRCEGPLRRADADVCVDVLIPAFEDTFDCELLIQGPPVCEVFPRDARPFDF